MFSRLGNFWVLLFLFHLSFGQESVPGKEIICPLDPTLNEFKIERHVHATKSGNSLLAVKSANIVVTYNGFTPEAQQAFQYAVDIWASLLESDVTIYVEANWVSMSSTTLGSARATTFHRNFTNAPLPFVFYPVALAEKLAGRGLNLDGSPDIVTSFNSNFVDWYFGTDGNSAGKYDFVTIVLHELGHGLGFSAPGITFGESESDWDLSGSPAMYTPFIENGDGQNILLVPNNSSELSDFLQSDNLFIGSSSVIVNNFGFPAKLYCPTTFKQGSSISHWDDGTFNNTENALMTHALSRGESLHDPGPITLSLLEDIGWSLPPTPVNDDITVDNLALSKNTVIPGETISVSCNHNYSGPTEADNLADPSVGYYLSNNVTYETGDILLESNISNLGSDHPTESESNSVTIPSNTTPGDYYVIFQGDYVDVIDEIHEFNNFGFLPITVEPAYLSIEPVNQNVNADKGTVAFEVDTNLDLFFAETDAEWISLTVTSDQVLVNYEANPTIEERIAVITVSGNNVTEVDIAITQEAGDPFLTISPLSVDVSYEEGTTEFVVNTNLHSFEASTEDGWLEYEIIDQNIEVDFQENKTLNVRMGIVTVSGNGLADQEISIVQAAGLPFLIIDPHERVVSYGQGSVSFDVETNLNNFTITTNDNWLVTSQEGDQLFVDYQANESINGRSGTISLNGSGVEEQLLTVIQQGAPPYLTLDNSAIKVSSQSGETSFTVDTNLAEFEVLTDAQWVETDTSNHLVFLSYLTNETLFEREAIIQVSGEGVSDQIFTLTQEAGDPYLEVLPISHSVEADEGLVNFDVNTNLPNLSFEENVDWLSITQSSVTGAEISFEENLSIENRKGIIIISGNNVEDILIEIDQAGAEPFLTIDPNSATVNSDKGNIEIEINTNLPVFNIFVNEEWIEFTLNNNILYIDYQENIDINSRVSLITFSGENIPDQHVEITQTGAPPFLSVSQNTFQLNNDKNTIEVELNSNLSEVEIFSETDWLSYSRSGSKLTVEIEKNTSLEERIGIISLKGDDVDDVAIQIVQEAGDPFLSISKSTQEVPSDAGEREIKLETNLPDLSVASTESWLNTALGDGAILIDFSQNPGFENRIAEVILSSSYVDDYHISIVQLGQIPFLKLSQYSLEVEADGGSFEIPFESNLGNLNILETPDWLEHEFDESTIVLKIEENKQFEQRMGKISIANEWIDDQTIIITQHAAVPFLTIENTEIVLEAGEGTVDIQFETNLNDFQIENIPDWVFVTREDQFININYEANEEVEDRMAELILSHDLVEDINLFITQKGKVLTGIEADIHFEFDVYPNPARDEVFISIPVSFGEEGLKLQIYDLNGKEQVNQLIWNDHSNDIRLDVNHLRAGVYILSVEISLHDINYRKKFLVK